jgi:hypothetical protein
MKHEFWFLSMLIAFVLAAGLARAAEPSVRSSECSHSCSAWLTPHKAAPSNTRTR